MTTLYGIAVYCNGGFGDQFTVSVMYQGNFNADLSSPTVVEDFQDDFEGHSADLVAQLQENLSSVAISNECGESVYVVGVDKTAVLKALTDEIFLDPENGFEFLEWLSVNETGDFVCVDTESDDADEEFCEQSD